MKRDTIQALRRELLTRLDITRELSDEEVMDEIDRLILTGLKENCYTLKDKVQLRQELFASVRKLDVLQELIDDDQVTEIMVNGPENVFVERAGIITRHDKSFTSREKLEDVIRQIAGQCNRVINESAPIADARLPNGARVNAVVPPVALDGPVLTIRRFPDRPVTMDRLIALGSIPEDCAVFLQKLVRSRYSILIGGGTGSGKTTLLSALAAYIPGDERVITIEDNAELRLLGLENLVRFEARAAYASGGREISIRELIRTALRCRPDRIIVGECRGEEALDMLQAFNTGHDGSMSTLHANTTEDMLIRLETMVLMGTKMPLEAIRRQIACGVDILVHLGRMRDKSRKLLEISEVLGFEQGEIRIHPLYSWDEKAGLVPRENLVRTGRLAQSGESL